MVDLRSRSRQQNLEVHGVSLIHHNDCFLEALTIGVTRCVITLKSARKRVYGLLPTISSINSDLIYWKTWNNLINESAKFLAFPSPSIDLTLDGQFFHLYPTKLHWSINWWKTMPFFLILDALDSLWNMHFVLPTFYFILRLLKLTRS